MTKHSTDIREALQQRILILDGAMGTRIQALGLTADSWHRGRFAQWPVPLTGNNDLLCLTAPDVIASIHQSYIDAGADIITTNTFSSNRISQQEYGCSDIAREMALAGAQLARRVADGASRQVWVAGSMGPTAKSLSMASDMNEPALRATDFDTMAAAYGEQAEALLQGGADMLILETCYDALNAKAALYAIEQLNERLGLQTPVMVSATINDRSGRTLTGQTLEAFFISISHYPHLLSFGLNCSFGVTDLRPFVEQLSERIPVYLSIYPNAGLPNEMGEYEELPDYTALHLKQMAEAGLLNIAGGCCGTCEHHIKAICHSLDGLKPRQLPPGDNRLWLSGLEPLLIDSKTRNFTNIGERTNVAGSRKFARLIAEKKYDEALSVARHQIEGGASVIDINMDDAMLDSRQEMQTFCRHISGEPAVSRAVLMIDSSDWPTVLAGLKNAQGKCIVNSISLKGGEDDFLTKARELRRLGAAVVVMAFDEEGQATTYERKTAIAERAYRLLTAIGLPPQDIIFDVNILSVATGISEHAAYAIDFIRAVEWIKGRLPLAKTSGGVSNLSFAFRGNNKVREAMHSVFLYHAIRAGLDMAIVNPTMLQVYDEIEPALKKAVEDVVLNKSPEATNELTAVAAKILETPTDSTAATSQDTWRDKSIEERLAYALSKGESSYLAEDVPEALRKYGRPIDVIEQPLMKAMEHIGQLFGEGKMFLPQVVKSAKVMKEAVTLLNKEMEAGTDDSLRREEDHQHCVVLATANGDVHDIGKNIVSIVLGCNGFQVVDLGVMVPCETIVEETKKRKPCLVGISGLITPSLKEMEQLCRSFQREGLRVPIIVGGATTSAVHTAVKLAPLYDGLVVYGGDASQTSVLAKRIELDLAAVTEETKAEQELLRNVYNDHHSPLVPYEKANELSEKLQVKSEKSLDTCHFSLDTCHLSLDTCHSSLATCHLSLDICHLIDWRMFLLFWGFKGETLQQQLVNPEAERTLNEGKRYLQRAIDEGLIEIKAIVNIEPATRHGNDIVLSDGQTLPMLRSQSERTHFRCLADYYDEQKPSPIGLFVVTARPTREPADDAEKLMSHALCARLAEAATTHLATISTTNKTREGELSAPQQAEGDLRQQAEGDMRPPLRVAFGYATCPDHSLKRIVFDRLDAERRMGITLTDHYSIEPSTSVCGLFIFHPEARYFPVGRIDRTQLEDYCRRRGISTEEGEVSVAVPAIVPGSARPV